MSDETKKYAYDAEARLEEFAHQFSRLVGEGVVRHADRERVRTDWIAAKFPPIVTFVRQHKLARPYVVEVA